MTKHSLTTAQLKILNAADEERVYLFSVGLFSTAIAVYLRIGDVGDADAILCANATSALQLLIPSGRPVYAWTDAGTAELCSAKQEREK